jgi:DNA adenine methylase
MIETFLKWVGGKNQIIKKVHELFPKAFDNYYEPFIGGGSVLIYLLNELEKDKKTLESINIGDFNKDLIELYENIKSDDTKLLDNLNKIVKNYNSAILIKKEKGPRKIIKVEETITKNIEKGKEYVYYFYRNEYNKLKKKENSTDSEIIYKSALFIFLNKTCFRGVYRENSKKEFNVPFGNYDNPEIYNDDNIKKLSKMFKKHNVNFVNCSFEEWKDKIKTTKKNFVYLDPPYYPVNESSFTKYTANDFNKKEHEELINFCKFIDVKNKSNFLLSNSDTDFIKDGLVDYETKIIECKRSINSKDPSAKINEVLIYNKLNYKKEDKKEGKKIKVSLKK